MKKRILCFGNIAYDMISDAGSPLSFEARPGGSVLNVAVLCARLGLDVSVLSKTGKDFMGDALLRFMGAQGINTRLCYRDASVKTGIALARIDKSGNSSYVFYRTEGPAAALKKDLVNEKLLKNVTVLHIGSAHSYNRYTFPDVLRLVKLANKNGIAVSYDPNWRKNRVKDVREARERIRRILPYADILKMSETDALGITGKRSLDSALRELPARVMITLGAKGSLLRDGKETLRHPALPVKVVDTIGAGDAFTSGLIYSYCRKGDVTFWEEKEDVLEFASAVSSVICSGKGATEALRGIPQVRQRMRRPSRGTR